MAKKFFVILILIAAIASFAAAASAGEAVQYSEFFPPPHIIAGQELAEILEEWRDQELATLILKQEEGDEEIF